MKFKLFVLVLLTALFAVPVLAQNVAPNTVSFNAIRFSFDPVLATSVNITQYPGDAPDLQQPGGPEAPYTEFDLYSGSAPISTFDAPAAIRVYRTADFASYAEQPLVLQQLQTLLTDRPDLTPFMAAAENASENPLPFLPTLPAAQVIRARAQFVDTPSMSGISYITVYRQDVSPFIGSEFLYTFQGISTDGAYYVSAVFRLNTALFPAEVPADFDMETFNTGFMDYLNQSIGQLNQATAEDFTPSLAMADAVIQSLAFEPMTAAPGMPTTEAPTAVPTNTDPTLGGLGGVTWTLVSYGAPEAPVAVLPNAPVTLTFSEGGAAGSAGCNTYSAPFQYDVSSLSFGEIVTTKMACDGVMDQENVYLAALATANSFTISGSQLQITYEGGLLTFTSGVSGLEGTWNLVSYGTPDSPLTVLPEAPISLILAGNAASGNGGCNTYGGSFVTDATAGTITFSNVVSTLMACTGTGVTEQESAYLTALNSATTFQVSESQLSIFYNGGVLNFARAV